MKIITKCKSCQQQIQIKSTSSDRYRLSKKIGEFTQLKCTQCNSIFDYHVDEFRAYQNKKVELGIFIILLSITIFIFILLIDTLSIIVGFVMIFPSLIWLIIVNQRGRRVINFNKYKISGHLTTVEWE